MTDDTRKSPTPLPTGFVMDWFMADVVEREVDGVSPAKASLVEGTTKLILQHLATYMREREIVFYGPSMERLEELRKDEQQRREQSE